MKKLTSLAVILSLATIGLSSPAIAHADTSTPTSTTVSATDVPTETYKQRFARLIAQSGASGEIRAQLDTLLQLLPEDADQRVAQFNAKLGLHETQWAEIAGSVINPGDYQCAETPLTRWVMDSVSDWDIVELFMAAATPMGQLPTYDALLFGAESKSNRFGVNGEYTNLLTSEMKDLRGFWDIQGDDIQLIPLHGADVFKNVDRVARILELIYGLPTDFSRELADAYVGLVDLLPGYRDGSHPFFSFNAFALDPFDEPDLLALGVTKRIVMGDGIMAGLAAIGIDQKVGPRSVLAHEYGHQVQFAKGLIDSPLTGAEGTRRIELMADAFGSYFMVQSLGEALNKARTLADQKSFYNVGDCNFGAAGHHGTPNQRYNTSAWAVGVANSAVDQGHKLPSLDFAALFEAKLPELVAPDAN